MTTNTSMTLYHKEFDTETRKDIWIRKVIDKVMWQGGKGASVNKGYDNANDVKIFVPKSNDLSNIEFSIGDIVVKGIIDRNITTQQDLTGVGDIYNLTTIINHDYGTLQHIELGGK